MQYELSFDSFTEIPFTSGTIQNINSQATVEVSTTDTPNTGIILYPGEKYEWSDATIYARAAWGNGETVMIAAETLVAGSGGGGGSYVLPIATKTVLGGVKSSDTVGKISVDNFGVMTYNAPDAQPLEAPEWAENTAYTVNALVEHNDDVYMCLVAHTSTSDFDADLAGGKWKLVGLALKVATTTQLGGVKANDTDGGVSVASDGVMTINLPTASTTVKGGIKVGTGVEVDLQKKLNVKAATSSVIGGVKSSTSDFNVSVDDSGNMLLNLSAIDFWKPNAEYTGLGTVRWAKNLRRAKKLAIVQGGTSDSTLSIDNISQADGSLIEDGTAVWIVDSFAGMHNSAGTRNSMYRGVDLTAYMDSGLMSANIANGTFTGIYPGDYVRKSVTIDGTTYADVKWIVMDLDYFLHAGDTDLTTHHIVLMPVNTLMLNTSMNDTNTTQGGYKGSKMWTTTIPLIDTGIESAFGSAHVLSHKELLSNAISTTAVSRGFGDWTGASSAWEWLAVKSNIPNEPMVYGDSPCSSSLFDVGNAPTQLAAFKHNPTLICAGRKWFWTRAVASSSRFTRAHGDGYANYNDAAYSTATGGVRPYFLYY